MTIGVAAIQRRLLSFDIARILRQHCKWEQNWILSRKEYVFYTIKALICYYPLRWRSQRGWDTKDWSAWPPEPIDVAYKGGGTYYIPGEPTIHYAYVIQVGRGVLSEWWAREEYVSD